MTKLNSQTSTSTKPPKASQSMGHVTKSSSSPSVAHSGFVPIPATSMEQTDLKSDRLVSGEEKVKFEERHSPACKPEIEEGNKLREEASEKKRPHSQQLKNIKYLTKAPSFEDTVDDFYPKTTFVPADQSVPYIDSKLSPSVVADLGPSSSGETGSDKKIVAGMTDSRSVQAQTTTIPISTTQAWPSQVTSASSSRRSILEEMPIPTMSHPAGSSSSDGGKGSEAAMTIPASPTIKRREISNSQSKIPTSPQTLRAADHLDSRKQDKLRQQQRKLVTAIKTDAKIGVTSHSSLQLSEKEKSEVEKGKSAPKGDRSSALLDNAFSGGCALSSRPSSQSDETLGVGRKSLSDQDGKDKNREASFLESKLDPTMERGKMLENKTQSPTTVRSMLPIKPESPKLGESSRQKLQPSLAKPRPFNMSSSYPQKKTTSGSSKSTSSASTTSSTAKPISATSSSSSPSQHANSGQSAFTLSEPLKRNTPSAAVASSQSATLCSKLAKTPTGTSSGLKKSNSEDSNSVTASSSSGKPSPVASSVARKGSGKAGDVSSSVNKPSGTRKTTAGGASLQPKKDGTESSPARQRRASGENTNPSQSSSKPIQRKSSGSGTPSGSPRRIHERCQEGAMKQSTRAQKASQSSTSVKPLPTTSASTSSTSSTATGTSASSKLSQDRTPRFV